MSQSEKQDPVAAKESVNIPAETLHPEPNPESAKDDVDSLAEALHSELKLGAEATP